METNGPQGRRPVRFGAAKEFSAVAHQAAKSAFATVSGRQARLKNVAMKEAAEKDGLRVDREQTLLGPGGLPTLKSDLVKMAALWSGKGKLKGIVEVVVHQVVASGPEVVVQQVVA